MFSLSQFKSRLGFSLIEVNMAIFVLAGGALALMSLFPMGLRYSSDARNEMRIAAFAERFMSAAQIAAASSEVGDVNDLANLLSGAPFNFDLAEDPGDYDETDVTHDAATDVYYRAWIVPEQTIDNKTSVQLGVQITAENAKQNKRAIRKGSIYMVRVTVDKKNKVR